MGNIFYSKKDRREIERKVESLETQVILSIWIPAYFIFFMIFVLYCFEENTASIGLVIVLGIIGSLVAASFFLGFIQMLLFLDFWIENKKEKWIKEVKIKNQIRFEKIVNNENNQIADIVFLKKKKSLSMEEAKSKIQKRNQGILHGVANMKNGSYRVSCQCCDHDIAFTERGLITSCQCPGVQNMKKQGV